MKKLLISAYAVSPVRGSECAVGWEISTRLAVFFDVTVLMCERTPSGDKYYDEVQAQMNKNRQFENIKFIPVPMPESSEKYTKLHDIGFWPAYYWGYNSWQKAAFKVAKELHNLEHFDAVYQLNMIGFREPGYLWKLDIPFFWGPTNGFHSIPFSFIKTYRGKDLLFQTIKHISNELQILLACRQKRAAKKASLVWCVDQKANNKLSSWGANTELLQETGLSVLEEGLNKKRTYSTERPLKLVWSGMITPGKALYILIEALNKINDKNFELTIIGDGELKKQMQDFSKPISNKIIWTGWLKKAEAIKIVSESDMLIHTSLKEGTPHSILEAIGMGIPVICHDTCGMGIVVNEMNGFKIPYKNSKISIEFVSRIISDILIKPEIINDKYESIAINVASNSWDYKVKHISDRINQVLSNN